MGALTSCSNKKQASRKFEPDQPTRSLQIKTPYQLNSDQTENPALTFHACGTKNPKDLQLRM